MATTVRRAEALYCRQYAGSRGRLAAPRTNIRRGVGPLVRRTLFARLAPSPDPRRSQADLAAQEDVKPA